MPYTSVPQDLTRIKPKTIAGLTKRQLIILPIAVAIGVPIFFVLRTVNVTLAALVMVGVMMPIISLSSYEKDGRSADYHIKNYLRHKKLASWRPYKTANMYKHLSESEDIIHANHKKTKNSYTPSKKRKTPAKSKNNKARKTTGHKK